MAHRCTAAFVAASMALVGLVAGCMPDIGTDPLPEVMELDPTGEPARVPEPTLLIVDPETGLLDFALAGVEVPADCAEAGEMPQAQCEFLTYLESLDGYPTLTPGRAPASAALDLASVTPGESLVVVDVTRGERVDALVVGFDEAARALTFDAEAGWEADTLYAVAVRGYAGGVRAADGSEVVASVLQALLRGEAALDCGAGAEVGPACPFYELFAGQLPADEVPATLVQLEGLRAQLRGLGVWEAVEEVGGLPREEVAVLWAFRTHSASVAELEPTKGLVPRAVGDRELRLGVKGSVDAATLTPFRTGAGGSVFLLDLTALEGNDLVGGLPTFTVSLEAGEIVLAADAPLVPEHLYGVLLTKAVTCEAGRALVPAPVSVLLAARGALVDAEGRSTVEGVSDADAAELEAGRADLALLLDDPLFATLTGLTREDLAYVYAFTYPQAGRRAR